MNSKDNATQRLGWRRVVAVLFLLGSWAGFHLLDGKGQRGSDSTGSGSATNSSVASSGSRAAARLHAANASAVTGSVLTPSPTNASATPAFAATVTLTASLKDKPSLRFNGHFFSFDSNAPTALADYQRRLGEESNAVVLLGLTVRIEPKVRATLASRGIEFLDYVPDNGWIARVRGTDEPSPYPSVFCFQPFDSSLRIQAELRKLALTRPEVPVYVHAVRDRPITTILDSLVAEGFEGLTAISVGDRAHLAGTIPLARVSEFLRLASAHPDTLWIERGQRARLLNAGASRTTQSGSSNGNTPFYERGIFGTGQVIAICDTGLDVDSCFFGSSEFSVGKSIG